MSKEIAEGNVLFPVFFKLNKILTTVIGGGNVGLEKVEALLKNDPNARIRIIATYFHPELEQIIASNSNIVAKKRKARSRDLRGTDLLILATDDQKLHVRLKRKAERRHLLTNVADTPHLCDFYLGSTVKKGDLKVGISTNGKSPTFAKRFREFLEEALPESTPELLDKLKSIRDDLKGDFQYKVNRLNEITSVMTEKRKREDEVGAETH